MGINYTNKYPLINGKDVFSASFFSWDGGNSYRMLSFLKLFGFPMGVSLGDINDDMISQINQMPAYPDNDCIKLFNNSLIVIKLSD